MNTEQLRAEFEEWYEKQMRETPRIAGDMYTPFATACWKAYQAGRAAPAMPAAHNRAEAQKLRGALCSEERPCTPPYFTDNGECAASLHAMAAQKEDDARDVARYRWLRDGGFLVLPYDDHGIGPEFPYREDLDAAIDQAMKEQV